MVVNGKFWLSVCVFVLKLVMLSVCVGVLGLSVDAVLYVWAGAGHIGRGNRLCGRSSCIGCRLMLEVILLLGSRNILY